jgi:hypothetical protein
MTDIRIRDYEASDADKLNRTAIAAFGQFRDHYQDWPAMLAGLSKTSDLSASGEVIIAEFQHAFAGAVVYFGPDRPKAPFFDQSWPIIRMLVVDPAFRGKGIRTGLDRRMHCQGETRSRTADRTPHQPDHVGGLADVSQDGLCQSL